MAFRLLSQMPYRGPYLNDAKIISWWSALKNDHTMLGPSFGAGSRLGNSNTVSSAARHSSSSTAKALGVAAVMKAFEVNTVIELGTNLGSSSAAIALLNPNARIHTVEGNSELLSRATAYFSYLKLNNILTYNKRFEDFLSQNTDIIRKADAIYLDGDHSYQATIDYIGKVLSTSFNGLIIMDDIRWSNGMLKAWKELIASLNHALFIDCFNMGIIHVSDRYFGRKTINYIPRKYKPFVTGLRP